MNTDEIAELDGDDLELKELVAAFVREFHRLPSRSDLESARFRRPAAAASA